MANIQVASDLHLETPKLLPMYDVFKLERKAPYLALLGDIGLAHDNRLYTFLEHHLTIFDKIFFIYGNHEPYESSWPAAKVRMRHFEAAWPDRFYIMDQTRIDLSPQVALLGCTLFSHITPDQQSTVSLFVSDFSNIPNWDIASHNAAHAADLAWLNAQMEEISKQEPHRKIVILTHHSPTTLAEANDPEHLEDSRGVQSAFATDLSGENCWRSENVKVWAFGHTHYNCDFVTERGLRVVSNARGYGRDDLFDFDPDKVISAEED